MAKVSQGCILDMGVEAGIVKRVVLGLTMVKSASGKEEKTKRTLKENPDVRDEIENKIRAEFDLPAVGRKKLSLLLVDELIPENSSNSRTAEQFLSRKRDHHRKVCP